MKSTIPANDSNWKAELSGAFTRLEDLLDYLELRSLQRSPEAEQRFPFRVTQSFAARMKKADPADPLLLQVLPALRELAESAGFIADPVGDRQAMAVPGVLRKYHGRALLITTGACAIHCRYCFRREFPYAGGHLSRQREAEALSHIAAEPTITEVILSGGDPLVLDDGRLGALVEGIVAIPHVMRLRIHTRLPIVLPSRVTPGLLKVLAGTRLKLVLVVHANHANEFDDGVRGALGRLAQAGVALLNQSVLLRGVNDSADALADLSETLFSHGVMPYYLHLLDKVRGAVHFDIADDTARELIGELRRRLPGYLVPKLVREVEGAPYKIPI